MKKIELCFLNGVIGQSTAQKFYAGVAGIGEKEHVGILKNVKIKKVTIHTIICKTLLISKEIQIFH